MGPVQPLPLTTSSKPKTGMRRRGCIEEKGTTRASRLCMASGGRKEGDKKEPLTKKN